MVTPMLLSQCVEDSRTVKFIYEEGRLKHILSSGSGDKLDLAVSYSPFKVVDATGGYYGFQQCEGKLNSKGYITSFKATIRSRSTSTFTEKCTAKMKYDDDGHLVEINVVNRVDDWLEGVQYLNADYDVKLTWSNGNLTKVTGEQTNSEYKSGRTAEITYGEQKNVTGSFPTYLAGCLGYTTPYANVLPFSYMSMLGFLGKGPKNLPAILYKGDSADILEYELNEDGAIAVERLFDGGTTYRYSYIKP